MSSRSFAMRVYAATYWLLSATFVYILVVLILPSMDQDPNTKAFLPILVGFLAVFVAAAAAVSYLPSAPRRPRLWLGLLLPPVAFLLMNAPYIPYPLTHPADIGFSAILPLVVGTVTLVVAGIVAAREARDPAATGTSGPRARLAVALVAGVTLGAFAAGLAAAGSAGTGGGALAGTPTVIQPLVVRNVAFETTSYSIGTSDVLGLFVENRDATSHSFDIDALNVHVSLPPNSTVAVAIKPTTAGTLEFYCSIPGHREAGMAGTIDVH